MVNTDSVSPKWFGIGALLVGIGVAMGAFGAHGLKGQLDQDSMEVYNKAVFYHLINSMGMVVVALMASLRVVSPRAGRRTLTLLLVGVVVFAGTRYGYAITHERWMAMITPVGGLSFIVAWVWLGLGLILRNGKAPHCP